MSKCWHLVRAFSLCHNMADGITWGWHCMGMALHGDGITCVIEGGRTMAYDYFIFMVDRILKWPLSILHTRNRHIPSSVSDSSDIIMQKNSMDFKKERLSSEGLAEPGKKSISWPRRFIVQGILFKRKSFVLQRQKVQVTGDLYFHEFSP